MCKWNDGLCDRNIGVYDANIDFCGRDASRVIRYVTAYVMEYQLM